MKPEALTVLDGYVGFDTLTEQIRKKALQQGFEFNVMVVGGAGLGKSTLINTLFRGTISRRSCYPEQYVTPSTVEIKSVSHVIEEKGILLKLTVTDTPGFGDHINNQDCWMPVVRYINGQYEKYLNEEISIIRRKQIPDTRVHCCLYFIPPTGHSLRPVDIAAMKNLVQVVNVIPVIAKSDSLTLEEREEFKLRIQEDLKLHNIRVYPDIEHNDGYDLVERTNISNIKNRLPFAIVGSDTLHQVGGKGVLGRKTNWGIVEVENETHCDFSHLRNLIIRTHLQDLKQVTTQIHYERFRHERLQSLKDMPLNAIGCTPPLPKSTAVKSDLASPKPQTEKKPSQVIKSEAATGAEACPKSNSTSTKPPPSKATQPQQNTKAVPSNTIAPSNGSVKPPLKTATAAKPNPLPVTQQKKNGVTHVTA